MRHQKKYDILIEFLSEDVRFWRCWTLPNALYISISVVFADYDKIENFIVDAERHRRTPRTLATWSKTFESKKSADIGDTGTEKGRKTCRNHEKSNQNHQQIKHKTPKSPKTPHQIHHQINKIVPKSPKSLNSPPRSIPNQAKCWPGGLREGLVKQAGWSLI